jgi:hypothetical protein
MKSSLINGIVEGVVYLSTLLNSCNYVRVVYVHLSAFHHFYRVLVIERKH